MRLAANDYWHVLVARLSEIIITLPSIRNHDASRHNGGLDEISKRVTAAICDAEPDATGIAPSLSLLIVCIRWPEYLNRACDGDHLVDASPFSPRSAANQRLVNFHMGFISAPDPILIRSYHPSPQLVENLESRFITRNPKLALELACRDPGGVGCHEVGTPKPDAQRCMASLDHRADRQPGILAALPTPQNPRAICKPKWLTNRFASRTLETLRPPAFLKI